MGKSLYLRNEVFAEWINKVDALVQDELGYSVVELILDDSQDYGIETTQVTIFAIQVALGELLKAHGAKPAAVVGQSRRGRIGLLRRRAVAGRRHPCHLLPLAPDGRGRGMLFGEYIRLMALVEYSAEEIKTVFSDPDLEVCARRADPDGDRRPAGAGGRDHRAGREGGQVRPQVPDQGRQPHPADGPAARRAGGRAAGHQAAVADGRHFSTVHEGSYIRPAANRSTTSTTGRRACGTASTSRRASATPSTADTPHSSSWRPTRWR